MRGTGSMVCLPAGQRENSGKQGGLHNEDGFFVLAP